MITEPRYWKTDLVRLADKLEKRFKQKRWTSSSTAALEKEVLVGAYAVRRLIESGHVSKSARAMSIKVTAYAHRNTLPKSLVRHFLHSYALMSGKPVRMNIKQVMNQFIHSSFFSPFVPFKRQMMGIF